MFTVSLTIVLVLALIITAIILLALSRPKAFRVERSITTSASPTATFAVIRDVRRFPEWSPWQKMDPAVKIENHGPEEGVGSGYSWSGNNKIGAGRMTVKELNLNQAVAIDLEFFRPFASKSNAVWRVEDEGPHRRITWSMFGDNENLQSRIFSLFIKMDKIVGKDFEEGLRNLKDLVEKK